MSPLAVAEINDPGPGWMITWRHRSDIADTGYKIT